MPGLYRAAAYPAFTTAGFRVSYSLHSVALPCCHAAPTCPIFHVDMHRSCVLCICPAVRRPRSRNRFAAPLHALHSERSCPGLYRGRCHELLSFLCCRALCLLGPCPSAWSCAPLRFQRCALRCASSVHVLVPCVPRLSHDVWVRAASASLSRACSCRAPRSALRSCPALCPDLPNTSGPNP